MKTLTALAVLSGFGLAPTVPVGAAVLIQVDVGNPAAVSFAATGNPTQVDDVSTNLNNGVDLLLFFTGAVPTYQPFAFSGTLAPPSANALSYDRSSGDNFTGPMTSVNIYHVGTFDEDIQNFSTAAPAFTGVGIANMIAYAELLPAPGASGNIIAGYLDSGSNVVLGQWAVVPEPSMLVLAGIGAAAMLCRRRNSIA